MLFPITLLIISFLIILFNYFSFRKIPLVGINILKNSGKDTAKTKVVSDVQENGFKGFISLTTTWSFWKVLFKSFFNNTKNEFISTFKKLFISTIVAISLFLIGIFTLFIELFILIF